MALAIGCAVLALIFGRVFLQAVRRAQPPRPLDDRARLARFQPATKAQRYAYLKALQEYRETFHDRLIGEEDDK